MAGTTSTYFHAVPFFEREINWDDVEGVPTQPGDTGRRLWHAGSNGRWKCGVVIAPEIDFAVLVACNRGIAAAWKTGQALKALILTFAPKRTS